MKEPKKIPRHARGDAITTDSYFRRNLGRGVLSMHLEFLRQQNQGNDFVLWKVEPESPGRNATI